MGKSIVNLVSTWLNLTLLLKSESNPTIITTFNLTSFYFANFRKTPFIQQAFIAMQLVWITK